MGADGDHLKYVKDVESAMRQGCTMITADLSEHLQTKYFYTDIAQLRKSFNRLSAETRKKIEKEYNASTFVTFSKEELMRVVLIYKKAIEHAHTLYKAAKKN